MRWLRPRGNRAWCRIKGGTQGCKPQGCKISKLRLILNSGRDLCEQWEASGHCPQTNEGTIGKSPIQKCMKKHVFESNCLAIEWRIEVRAHVRRATYTCVSSMIPWAVDRRKLSLLSLDPDCGSGSQSYTWTLAATVCQVFYWTLGLQ